jgi:triosephosphate isomerase
MPDTRNVTRQTPILAGNWKMNKGPGETRRFFTNFLAAHAPRSDRSVWFFPPAVSIEAAVSALEMRPDIVVGAQNIHWEAAGAFTGENSATMVREAGAQIVLVGHSERRHIFGESDQQVARKVKAALDAGLHVLVCLGEKLDERKAGQLEAVLKRQLEAALASIPAAAIDRLTVAYEPVWAIGTGVNATPQDAASAHRFLRERIAAVAGQEVARTTPILYGGSVNPDNAADLLAASDVNGLLVGGASLQPGSFARIAASAGSG